MRYRLTVSDEATGVRSDVVVECDGTDSAGTVLDLVAAALPVAGIPTVHGVPVDPAVPVSESALRDGAVLDYGAQSQPGPGDPFGPGVNTDRFGLRILSGPSAGTQVDIAAGSGLEIGRATACGLVIADPDVSRRHAIVRAVSGGFELDDTGSANGVLVDGNRIMAPHPLREGEIVQLGASRLVLEHRARTGAVLTRSPDGDYLLNRRFADRREPFVAPTVSLPTPLPEDDARGIPLLAMLLPLVLACALAYFLSSPIYLLFGLLSPVLLGANWWTERRRTRVRDQRQQGSYGDKLTAARTRVESAMDDEDADLRQRLPDPATVSRTALALRRELWARRPGDGDWLAIRVGTADLPASVQVNGERPAGWEEPVLRGAPVGVDLETVGVFGLAGPPEWLALRLGWVLTQCAVLHSPDELQVAVLAPNAAEDESGWLRWLPHVRAGNGVLAAWDDEGVDGLVRGLGVVVDRRAAVADRRRPVGQLLVVLVGAGALARRPQIADLLARGPSSGLRFVCLDSDDRLLPEACRAVLAGDDGRSELRVDQGPLLAVVPDRLAPGAAERIARTLAPLRRVGDTPAGGIPDSVRFTDLTALPDPEELRARWRLRPERTDVVLGRDGDGPFAVDIARDGPHAVIAGTSGAGKSELLQTWVAALALANTPETLSVVFMDYKGGAAFRDLVGLPHVVGTVTNLDGRLAVRALSSLRAELTRRQHQLATAGASDRADYRRRAELDPTLAPFPRLLIVVDELAELKDNLPSLVDGLVGVARIGRSLGVHLVLATQKPAGVVDAQIRANVDLRICLRTRDEGESLDVIEVGDAAQIPKDRPGRALAVRGGSTPTLVQTARVTTPCETGAVAVRRAVALRWTAVAVPAPASRETEGLRTDLNALVDTVAAAAENDGLVAPFHPWTPPLPSVAVLDELPATPRELLLGLQDRPEAQSQDPLHLPLGAGHLGLIGSGRTGRTSALRAIAAGLARANPPTEVHIHVVDGPGALAGLVALPHVGVVANEDDPERLERLLTRLADEVRRRRRLLTERGAATVAELGADAPPAIVLLVDDWLGVVEGDGPAQAAMQELLTGGATAAGVTVCIAGDERLLRGRLLNRLDHRLCLRLNNPSDATALGLSVRNLPDGLPPGRALWSADGTEVQLPLLARSQSGPAQAAALAAVAGILRERHGDPDGPDAPMRLDPLPVRIGLVAAGALPAHGAGEVLVGVSGDRLRGVRITLGDATGHLLIAGPSRSGRSTAAATIAAAAAGTGVSTVLVAARPGEPHRAAARAGVTVVAPDALTAALDAGVAVVVVDDSESVSLDDALVARLTGPDGPALVVAALLDSFGFGGRGLVLAAKKGAGPVVLLCPPNHLSAENVGIRIDRGAAFTGPAGRAILSVDGDLLLGQVPDVAVD